MGLVERAACLSRLVEQLGAARTNGRLVLVSGEAGIGKTALVDAFCEQLAPEGRVLVGRCDDLFASRPLGPLADIARTCGGGLRDALRRDDRAAAFDAFLDELSRPPGPVVAVLEDLQWADEATLDLMRFVARRLPALPALVIATYRDDVDRDHPLRLALGDLVPPTVARIHLDALSVEAVGVMAAGTSLDPVALHATTGGNPFFVTEVLADGDGAVPATVRDAVLARAVRLSHHARATLDAAAILGNRARHEVLLAVAESGPAALDECVGGGFLGDDAGDLSFRHDLARLAIDEAIRPWRRRRLHALAVDALGDDPDVVRRAHHAVGADDGDAVLDVVPRAAARCTALGAHREAAMLLGGAVRYADRLAPDARATVFEAWARSCDRGDQLDEALEAGAEVLEHHRSVGDPVGLASWLTWMTCRYRSVGNAAAAASAIQEAIAILEPLGESVELARAVATLAQERMLLDDAARAIAVGERAFAMAERVGAEDVAVHALNTVGTSQSCRGDDAGLVLLRQSLTRARAAGLDWDVARAYNNLQSGYVFTYLPAEAMRCFDEGLPVAVEGELRFWEQCMLSDHATALALDGRWDDAVEHARMVLAHVGTANVNRVSTLVAIGRIRARRGDPDPFGPLDEALALAEPYGELQLDHPVRMARAEASWLAGDIERAGGEVAATFDATMSTGSPWFRGELALWCLRAGIGDRVGATAEPFALHVGGLHHKAAAAWHDRGCPYEEADALGDSSDEADLRRALDVLHGLGATPRAAQVGARLRGLGVTSLPRGPRPSTRANPAGLTAREFDVLALLCEDLRNAEIADRLVVSPKTVDHHVSAILTKLAVANRREAVSAAVALGMQPQLGERAVPR